MIRRYLCAAVFFLLLLSVPACSEKKPTYPVKNDPDGNYVPKAGGGKAG
jgi:hypothetical protein